MEYLIGYLVFGATFWLVVISSRWYEGVDITLDYVFLLPIASLFWPLSLLSNSILSHLCDSAENTLIKGRRK